MADIHIREVSTTSSSPASRTKPVPQASSIPVPFTYSPSDDGTDENLLILLHGLGDTHVPFAKLGRQLNLPQTATLSLRAPEQIPFLYEQSFQWYPSFDPLGDLIESPNPTTALNLLSKILSYLIDTCTWPPERIHLFGFAQGGSVAVELSLKWWKEQLNRVSKIKSSSEEPFRPLGSIVTVSGPLLSYPTLSKICTTPVLVFHRPAPSESALSSGDISALKKGFGTIVEAKKGGSGGMPRSKEEWEPIMKFWSERLGRRLGEGLFEVLSGAGT